MFTLVLLLRLCEGWYPMSRRTGALVPCWDRIASDVGDLLLVRCGVHGVCNGSGVCNSANFSCAFGFDPASRLCSRCLGGRFLSGGACVACRWYWRVCLSAAERRAASEVCV